MFLIWIFLFPIIWDELFSFFAITVQLITKNSEACLTSTYDIEDMVPSFLLKTLVSEFCLCSWAFFFNGNYWFSIAADILFFRFAVNGVLFTRNWYPILFVLTLVRYFLFPSFSLSLFSYKRIDLFFIDLFKNLSVQSGLRSLVLAGARYLANFTLNTRFVTRDFPKFLTFYSRWGFYLQGHVMSFEPQIVMVRYPKVLFKRLLATFVFELTLFCIVIFPIS